MNSNAKKFITLSIFVLLFLFVLYSIKQMNIKNIIASFENVSLHLVLEYLSASFLIMVTLTLRWMIILHSKTFKSNINLTKPVSFFNLFNYRLVGYAISFITPSAKLGGEPFRAKLLTRHGYTMSQAMSNVWADKQMEIAGLGLFFVVSLAFLPFMTDISNTLKYMLIIISILLVSVVGLFYRSIILERSFITSIIKFLRLHKFKKVSSNLYKIRQVETTIIKFHKKEKVVFIVSSLLTLLSWILMFWEFRVAINFFGIAPSIFQIFMTFSLIGLAYLFPVPLAIGPAEGALALYFKSIGISTIKGFALANLVRFRDLMWTSYGLLLLVFYRISIKDSKKLMEYDKNKS